MARGSIKKRSKVKNTWTIILDLGYKTNDKGKRVRNQKWITVQGTKREAEARLAELLHKANQGDFVEPSKLTFGQWLDHWLETTVKPPATRPRTYETYEIVIRRHVKPTIGKIRLQELDAMHLEEYYRKKGETLSQTTLKQHHAVISKALKSAVVKKYVQNNVATLVENKPKVTEKPPGAVVNCWEKEEAQKFLKEARKRDAQTVAQFALALDSGARRSELRGLKWENVNLEEGTVRIIEQLVRYDKKLIAGPPKNGKPRTIHISAETVSLLNLHRKEQLELKLRNGKAYEDQGLVFAKQWDQMTRKHHSLGEPLVRGAVNKDFEALIKTTEVKRISFHGLRHTSATLLLQAGIPVHAVSERLGHKSVDITMNVYAHVLPSMHEEITTELSGLLYGTR